MKKVILFLIFIVSFSVSSQTILMSDGRSDTCAGTFYDSGGAIGNYGNNESFTYTFCPDVVGAQTQLDFTTWDLETNVDFMVIYNGPDTTYDLLGTFSATSPGVITASLVSTDPLGGIDNPDGCLTVVFSSDAVTANTGWEATISCFEPCQTITSQIDSTIPALDANDVVRICQGESVTFNGSGTFSDDGTGATYDWDFDDGSTASGASVTHAFANEGIYQVNLVITDTNPQGCRSTNKSAVFVYVSSTPDFSATVPADATLCLGESTTITGEADPVTQVADCANGGEETALGDVQGVTFTSSLDLECFQGQTLTNVSQLESICIIMEHTYIGDLEITAISPNGQRVLLHNRTGTNRQLGDPITTDGTGAGIGWEYCFSMSGATILSDGPTVTSGSPAPAATIEPGTYLPVGDFNDFVGSTIDGEWTLEILDHLEDDDGTIFSWSLNFDESLLASDYAFTPTITSESWDADPSITNTVGNTITVQPATPGIHCYTYRVIDDFGCEYTHEVCVEVFPEVVPIAPTPLETCDDTTADGLTAFDLTLKDVEITAGNPDWVVTYFETLLDAQNDTNVINPASSYTNTVNFQTVHARVTDNITGCFGLTTLVLNVLPNPQSLDDAPDLELCDDNNPGDEIEVFDLTLNEAYILNGEVNVTATYYESNTDAQSGTNAIAAPTAYTNTSSPQTIYVRVTNDITNCFTVVSFDILVNPLPETTTVTDYFICEENADGVNQFDLDSKTLEVLNGQDPTSFVVTYHISQGDADSGANALVSPYTNITNPQPIFVRITNTSTGCSISTITFNIEELNTPSANPDLIPINYTLCDDFGANDGVVQFDLPTQDVFVLDGQDPLVYSVTYYPTQLDADQGTNVLTNIYENISNPQIIYARVEATSAVNISCYSTTELTLNVDLLPEFSLNDNYVVCTNTNGTEVVGPPLIDTGLSTLNYTFEWLLDGVPIPGATNSSYLALQAGNYSVTVTDNATACQRTENTIVIESSPPIISATVTSLVFSSNNTIEVEAIGNGTYEYSLDNGPWQESNVFENVSLGEHVIMVRDLNGCGYAITTIIVMDYPKYFTPNGDGYHDTWRIAGIEIQPNAKIFIYDRFGKLLKQLSPTGNGWDGTFNGNNLPAADYWFTVTYMEPSDGSVKTFKAHFALKR